MVSALLQQLRDTAGVETKGSEGSKVSTKAARIEQDRKDVRKRKRGEIAGGEANRGVRACAKTNRKKEDVLANQSGGSKRTTRFLGLLGTVLTGKKNRREERKTEAGPDNAGKEKPVNRRYREHESSLTKGRPSKNRNAEVKSAKTEKAAWESRKKKRKNPLILKIEATCREIVPLKKAQGEEAENTESTREYASKVIVALIRHRDETCTRGPQSKKSRRGKKRNGGNACKAGKKGTDRGREAQTVIAGCNGGAAPFEGEGKGA